MSSTAPGTVAGTFLLLIVPVTLCVIAASLVALYSKAATLRRLVRRCSESKKIDGESDLTEALVELEAEGSSDVADDEAAPPSEADTRDRSLQVVKLLYAGGLVTKGRRLSEQARVSRIRTGPGRSSRIDSPADLATFGTPGASLGG